MILPNTEIRSRGAACELNGQWEDTRVRVARTTTSFTRIDAALRYSRDCRNLVPRNVLRAF